jgi:transposase
VGSKNIVRRAKIIAPVHLRRKYTKHPDRVRKARAADATKVDFAIMYDRLKLGTISSCMNEPIHGKIFSYCVWHRVLKMKGVWEKHREGKSAAWTNEQVTTIMDYIGENTTTTLKETLKYATETLHYPNIAVSTLASYCEMKLIVWKRTVFHPFSRNQHETKLQRKAHATWLLNNSARRIIYVDGMPFSKKNPVSYSHLYYCFTMFFPLLMHGYVFGIYAYSESGFNLWTRPGKAWGRYGEAPEVVGCSQPGLNRSVCMGIDSHVGVFHWEQKDGAFNTEKFNVFFANLVVKLKKEDEAIIIMDNARIHSEKDLIAICGDRCKVKFLPPYSPMFNPIENVFGFLKGRIRHLMYSDEFKPKLAAASTAEWGQKVQLRGALVSELLQRCISSITKQEVQNTYHHVMGQIGSAIDMHDL